MATQASRSRGTRRDPVLIFQAAPGVNLAGGVGQGAWEHGLAGGQQENGVQVCLSGRRQP